MRVSWPHSVREPFQITVATDGSQFIPSTGEVIDIPPWLQWQARAALAVGTTSPAIIARRHPQNTTGQPPNCSGYALVSINTSKRSAPLELAGLTSVIDAIRPGVAYCQLATAESEAPVEAGERHHLATMRTPDAMPLAAAFSTHDLFYAELKAEFMRSWPRDRPAAPEGLEWLLEHGLAEWDQHRRRHRLTSWFSENLKARTGVHVGPRLQTRWV